VSIQYKCKNLLELVDFTLSTAMRAPDNFAAWSGLDLEKAVAIIRGGFDTCGSEIGDARKERHMRSLVEQAHAAYSRGDTVKGSHLLQEAVHVLHLPETE